MYNSLSNGIELSRSANYIKLALFLYLFAFMMLMNASFGIFIKAILSVAVSVQLRLLIKSPYPGGRLNLQYLNEEWIIHRNSQTQIFTKRRLLLNTGVFFLLEFSSPTQRIVIPVFLDQLSSTEFRSIILGLNVNEL
ncbi:hypothetical protein Lbir_0301 [Legionella birminghamensis]|uniref:Toxin CptA n=3 Tax=Legionella birminghamensis TaxID=28083 RepID=A0A378II98_9GAMM|nr:hypothetical protein Lbir_0301 [Legionella birminghamensis]STX31904.1 Uncharacterised protein [Legionella birminghamensis]